MHTIEMAHARMRELRKTANRSRAHQPAQPKRRAEKRAARKR
ncbi:hypothetical protein ACWDX6_14265 [Streptomyces sp. NPDC003027]